MKFNLIGAGRLGQCLAKALCQHQLGTLMGVYNRSQAGSTLACERIGFGHAVASVSGLPQADFIFVTPPDDAIAGVVAQLVSEGQLKPGTMVIHCSGVLSYQVLEPLRQRGCMIGSIHPLKAFPEAVVDGDAFNGVFCAVEGDDEVTRALDRLWNAMKANLLKIDAHHKIRYHTAAIMASNYLVTIAHYARTLFHESGLSIEEAKQVSDDLMQSSLNNLMQSDSAKHALTGPLSRGDVQTIQKHLKSLESNRETNDLYRALAQATLPLTRLSEESLKSLEARLVG